MVKVISIFILIVIIIVCDDFYINVIAILHLTIVDIKGDLLSRYLYKVLMLQPHSSIFFSFL